MSDINIEDFIHETRSMQDSYDRADSRDCLDDVFADAELREYLDKALTLARSYDKLLRELDVANRTAAVQSFDMWKTIGMPGLTPPSWDIGYTSPTYGPIVSDVPPLPSPLHLDSPGLTGTVWKTNTPPTAANIASTLTGHTGSADATGSVKSEDY